MQRPNGERNGLGRAGQIPWVHDPDRPRDPESGYLVGRHCELYRAGHTVHYIRANRSSVKHSRSGRLQKVVDNVLTVDFGDEVKHYRNHDPERLVDIIRLGGIVHVCEPYVILRGAGGYCFSISDATKGWVACDFRPLKESTPKSLAERIETHGGFIVPGQALTAAIEEGA
jgi:hypothetical protein